MVETWENDGWSLVMVEDAAGDDFMALKKSKVVGESLITCCIDKEIYDIYIARGDDGPRFLSDEWEAMLDAMVV